MRCEELDLLNSDFGSGEKLFKTSSLDQPRKYNLTFDGLSPGKNYKLVFSTEVDGRTVTQAIRNFECID